MCSNGFTPTDINQNYQAQDNGTLCKAHNGFDRAGEMPKRNENYPICFTEATKIREEND